MQVLNHIRTRTEHRPDRKGASPSAWVRVPARSEGARGGVPVSDGAGFIDSICVNMHQHACLMLRALHHGRLRKASSQHAHSTPCAWPSSTPPAGQGMCAGEWGSWSRAITSSYHHLAGPSACRRTKSSSVALAELARELAASDSSYALKPVAGEGPGKVHAPEALCCVFRQYTVC